MNLFTKVSHNSLYALISHLAPRLANVIIFILIGRLRGPSSAGVFSLATTYLLIFTAIMRGLDDLIVRQVSRDPENISYYFGSFLALRFGLSLLAWGILLLFMFDIFHYKISTTLIILLLSITILPDNLAYVAQAVLIGKQRFGLVAVITGFSSIIKLLGGSLCIILGKSLINIAGIWILSSLINLLITLTATIKLLGSIKNAIKPKLSLLQEYKLTILAFLSITLLLTLETQADVILLKYFHNESVVGWYSAAVTIVAGMTMFSQAYQMAVYPMMSQYAALREAKKLHYLYRESLHYLGLIALPIIAEIAILSPQLIPPIFGNQFSPTVPTLRILIWSLLFLFLSTPITRMMLVRNEQNLVSLFVILSLMVNFILNWELDPAWGANGAAIARVCSTALYFFLSYIHILRTWDNSNVLHKLAPSLLSTLGMSIVIWPIRDFPLILSAGIGIIVYLLVSWKLHKRITLGFTSPSG